MKTDLKIREDVRKKLKCQPLLKASDIAVAVDHGVVTLSGIVNNCAQKLAAEKAAGKVSGVKALTEHIEVRMSPGYSKADESNAMTRNRLMIKRIVSTWKIKISVTDLQEFTEEETALLELLSGTMNYADILKHYSLSTDLIFCHISTMYKKLFTQKDKIVADHFLYISMLKLTGVTDERVNQTKAPVIDKEILLHSEFGLN